MDRKALQDALGAFIQQEEGNAVSPDWPFSWGVAGMPLLEPPLIGISSADDPLYGRMKEKEAVGPWHMGPQEWLTGAKTVISLFFPFTEAVRRDNAGVELPSNGWLHARIEGHALLAKACAHGRGLLEQAGFRAVSPSVDPRFASVEEPGGSGSFPPGTGYTSRWSERHVAYISGLGTFGLSKGLITPRGVCGRFGSIVTDWQAEPTPRSYTGIYDYCTRCGACVRRCPAGAISLEGGKRHPPCAALLDETRARHRPYYGCGKCQTGVPCQRGIPGQR